MGLKVYNKFIFCTLLIQISKICKHRKIHFVDLPGTQLGGDGENDPFIRHVTVAVPFIINPIEQLNVTDPPTVTFPDIDGAPLSITGTMQPIQNQTLKFC